MKKKSNRRWILYVGLALVVVVVGVVLYGRFVLQSGAGKSAFQTQKIEKGSLTAYVGATGTVRSNQTATLGWQTTGIVDRVYVEKGQAVDTDAVLADLQQTSLSPAIISAQISLVADQKALDDLLASNVDRVNAELALIKAEQALVDAQKAAQSKQFQRASQETIDIARANLIQAQSALDDAAAIYDRNKSRSSDDVIYAAALSQFAAAQQQFDKAQMNLNYVQGLPDPLDLQTANANVELAQAQLANAKRAWERVKDGPNPDDVAAAQAKIAADQATLDQARITAPFAGTITVINTHTGDVVSPTAQGFQLDDLSRLFVDIAVSEVDINRVQIGQPVELTLDAITGQTYQGAVSDITNVGVQTSGTVNFTVTVEITDRDPQIKPGMTVAANIAVTSLEDVLIVPNRAIRSVNGKRVVFILKNGVPTPVPVTLGATSSSDSQILSGDVNVGDEIVLNPPTALLMGPQGGGVMFRSGGSANDNGGSATQPAGGK